MVRAAIDIAASQVDLFILIKIVSFATAQIVSIISLNLVLFAVEASKDEAFVYGHLG